MKRSLLTTGALVALFAGFFGTSLVLQRKGIAAVKAQDPFYETWQLQGRSGDVMKLMALRYDLVAADFLWLRSIQSFGGRGMTNRDWRPIYNLFETITELDPYFEHAYTFGNLVIGDEGGHQEEALKLLEKGTFRVNRQYRIPFEGMYVAHWQMSDIDTARWYGRISSRRPDAPDWVSRITAFIDVASGQYYIGLDRFVGNLMQAIESDEYALQDIAVLKAAETIDKWNASQLTKAADEFTSRTGRRPTSVAELADMPALQNFESADLGRLLAEALKIGEALGYKGIDERILAEFAPPDQQLLQQPLKTTGTLEGKKPSDFQNQVFEASLVTRSGVPPHPNGGAYHIDLARYGRAKYKPEEIFVSEKKLEENLTEMLGNLRMIIADRKQELGRNPESLTEVFQTEFNTPEPFGGRWIYDPATAEIKSSSRPML